MAQKTKVSHKGVFGYPWLQKADTRYKTEGEFKVFLTTLPSDKENYPKAQALVKEIKSMAKAHLEKCQSEATDLKAKKKLKLCPDVPFSVDDETGAITFKFRTQASGTDKKTDEKWTRKIPIFGADAKLLETHSFRIGGGTIGKVSYIPSPWVSAKGEVGVKLALVSAQVLELVEYESDGTRFGFEDESSPEDGGSDETPSGEDEDSYVSPDEDDEDNTEADDF